MEGGGSFTMELTLAPPYKVYYLSRILLHRNYILKVFYKQGFLP